MVTSLTEKEPGPFMQIPNPNSNDHIKSNQLVEVKNKTC